MHRDRDPSDDANNTPDVIDRQQIEEAYERISGMVRRTPLLTSNGEGFGVTRFEHLHLKLEHTQHSGSFKARGALHALMTTEVGPAGVVAASGGNHGAAVAWAAARLGYRATVFVPTVATEAKVQRLRDYGADVHIVGSVYADALAAAGDFASRSGAVAIHAYDQRQVVAGAGTVALELEQQVPGCEVALVACGGGGLAGGMASWFGTEVPLIAVETEGTATYASALEQGGPTDVEVTGLAADSLGATRLGSLGWSAMSRAGTASIVVSDSAVAKARRLLWERFRLLVEPAAAAPLAALDVPHPVLNASSVAVILCGANTPPGL